MVRSDLDVNGVPKARGGDVRDALGGGSDGHAWERLVLDPARQLLQCLRVLDVMRPIALSHISLQNFLFL